MERDYHETAIRALEEESRGYDAGCTIEMMRRHVAYMDKLRADRLYLARSVANQREAVTKNRDYYEKRISDLEKQVAILKEQLADAELGKDR